MYSAIDTDAIDGLFHTDSGQLTFEYRGYVVAVPATGEVRVFPFGSE